MKLKPNKGLIAGAVLVIILLIAAAFFASRHNDKASTNNSNAPASGVKLLIKEFGIELTLPRPLTYMTYSTAKLPTSTKHTFPPVVNLEVAQYSNLVQKCLGTSTNGAYPFAELVKLSGQAKGEKTNVLKQFDTFHIDSLGSDVSKKLKCKDSSTSQDLQNLSSTLNTALKESFSSAKTL